MTGCLRPAIQKGLLGANGLRAGVLQPPRQPANVVRSSYSQSGCLPADAARDALAQRRRNSARSALYLAAARLHSDPDIMASPPAPQTAHFHRPRPRCFNKMSSPA